LREADNNLSPTIACQIGCLENDDRFLAGQGQLRDLMEASAIDPVKQEPIGRSQQ
jgi:hypothetical protein